MQSQRSSSSLLIFGGSTRAAAQSARRAGMSAICADRFADEDLYESAEVLATIEHWPNLIRIAQTSPAARWIYTGGMENRPALVKRLARLRPLFGNAHDVLRAVRNPGRLHAALAQADLPTLCVKTGDSPPEPDGSWLRKPVRGSGGRGIWVWDESAAKAAAPRGKIYFQKRVAGNPISSMYLATAAGSVLIGVCEQWSGAAEWFGRGFAFCGAVGPCPVPDSIRRQVEETGRLVAKAFCLRGLFGIDWVVAESTAWPTEVNPRYTASVEIYERALEVALLDWHCRACDAFADPSQSAALCEALRAALERAHNEQSDAQIAKAVVYAPFNVRTPDLKAFGQSESVRAAGVQIADRPASGTLVRRGLPLCTMLAPVAKARGLAALDAVRREFVAILGRHRIQDDHRASDPVD